MQNILFGEFAAHFGFMGDYRATIEERLKTNIHPIFGIDIPYWTILTDRLSSLLKIMENIELFVAAGYLRDALQILHGAQEQDGRRIMDMAVARELLQHLQYAGNITVRELQTKHFLLLNPTEAAVVDPTFEAWGKGGNFRSAFQSATYDIDEAAKCLAFGRGTACVFHLMRVFEIGARAVYHHLQIPTPLIGNDRNLGTVLRRIHDEIEKRGKKWPEYEALTEIWLSLDAVKNVWRNVTMHVEAKYTPEEANRIHHTIQGVMYRITSRMDENGVPKV